MSSVPNSVPDSDPISSATALNRLAERLDQCLGSERGELLRHWRGLRRRVESGKPIDRALPALGAAIERSIEAVTARRAALPVPDFDPRLPINRHRERIAEAVRDHQVVVVCGETGSGKTTQLPKLCLELGLGARGLIGHTQPRRIAARSVAARIAEELGDRVGGKVGYKVRFSDRVGPDSLIKLMTDGILLAETRSDRLLEQYEVLIVDEAHERSLNIDFLLGYLRRLLPRRPDLKVIITSATIDPERFSKHFNSAPIIEVSGRGHPVEIRYRPLISADEDERDRDREQAILDAVDELAGLDRAAGGPGDILIFLDGERDIRDTAEALRKHKLRDTEVLPLYARLSTTEQNRVFQPHAGRRIVLATNVAETSLTVPGIRYVIDPGTARISRYSTRAKVQRLPIEPISQASAAQRAGRCGRVAPGVCIRLYAEDDFNARPAFTDPEILRTNLAAVILQMAALNLGEIEDFPFLEPPERRQITDGYKLLFELDAVDERRRITELGRRLARLPLDPRPGRMLLAAAEFGSLREVLIIAAALVIQDPRERPLDHQQAADEKHRRFRDERSDFLALLSLWEHYHEQARHLSRNKLRQLCHDEFLSYVRMREWHDLHQELHARVTEMGLRLNDEPPDYAAIHRALLCGLLGQVGLVDREDRTWRGARGRKFQIFPGSGLFRKGPKWLMAAELVETSRLYARTVARIDPEWIEALASHLVRRHHSEPHWEERPARVVALEQVTLYGLPLVGGRKVDYGRIDPPLARELFIREALVNGRFRTCGAFFEHNRALIEDIHELETRTRRRDLLVDEETLYRFYDARIPAEVRDGPSFEHWWRQAGREQPRLLYLSREDLLARGADGDASERFPDRLVLDGLELPLSYRFEPTAEDDGVTVTVPLAALNQIDPRRLEWLVPGLLPQRMTALLKALPKALRKHFVPVPDFVRALLESRPAVGHSLTEFMTRRLEAMTGMSVPASAWPPEQLPLHLSMRVRVVDDGGRELAVGRDLQALQRQLRGSAREEFAERSQRVLERDTVGDWDFGELPERVEFEQGGVRLKGYPALVVEGDGLALRLLDTPARAAREHRAGVRRLLARKLRDKVRYLQRQLPGLQTMSLHYMSIGTQRELLADLLDAAIDRACLDDRPIPRDPEALREALARGRARLVEVADRLAAQVAEILATHHRIQQRLRDARSAVRQEAVEDIRMQLAGLVYPGFIGATPPAWFGHLPRYLKAIELRLDKLDQAPDKDRQRRALVEPLWQAWQRRSMALAERGGEDPELAEFRWLIEELRVSQFAQELRTAQPVSVKRLEQRWQELTEA